MKLRLPRFLDSRYMKVARLSALRTGRLYSTEDIPSTLLIRGRVDPRAIVQSEGLSQREIQQDHRKWNPRPFGLQRSESTNCTPRNPLAR